MMILDCQRNFFLTAVTVKETTTIHNELSSKITHYRPKIDRKDERYYITTMIQNSSEYDILIFWTIRNFFQKYIYDLRYLGYPIWNIS